MSSEIYTPNEDHTFQTDYGSFLYISGPGHEAGELGRVESGVQSPTEGSCLEFYYFMSGDGVGALNLFVRRGEFVDAKPIWKLAQV